MKASWYAEALYGALTSHTVKDVRDVEKIFTHFRKVITSRGHEKLLPLVGREFEKITLREEEKHAAYLITADGKHDEKWAHAYDHYVKEGILPKGAVRHNVVDETLVGGFQIRTKGVLIDGSYKRSLIELYRKITN